jgi:hypothetical protein
MVDEPEIPAASGVPARWPVAAASTDYESVALIAQLPAHFDPSWGEPDAVRGLAGPPGVPFR